MRAQIQKTAAPVKSSDLETAELLSGIESGGGMANKLHGTPMAYGAGIGGAAGLLREYMRHKSEAEKAQPAWRKVLRYAGQGGLGALAGTGVGGVAGHLLSNAVTDQASNDKYKALYKAHREQTDLSKTTNGWVPKPPHVMDIAQGIDDKSNALSEAVLGKALSGKSGSAKIAELKLAPLAGVKKPNTDKGTSLNQLLEQTRKKREEKEKKQPAQKAAARGDQAMQQEKEYNADSRASNFAALTRGIAKEHKPEDFAGGGRLMRGSPVKKDQERVQQYAQHVKKLRAKNKTASAYEFGRMVKRSFPDLSQIGNTIKETWNSPGVQRFVNDPTTQAGLTYGGIGAGLGGLYGLVNPGEYEDEYGNIRRRGRLSGALRGALGGGALGGLAGAGAQEGRFQYLKHMMNQRAGFPNAMGGLDRGEALENAEAFAQNNPGAVGALGTSPLQGAQNAYSAASNAVSNYMPKRMGKAPAIGVETPAKAPEVKKTDEQA